MKKGTLSFQKNRRTLFYFARFVSSSSRQTTFGW